MQEVSGSIPLSSTTFRFMIETMKQDQVQRLVLKARRFVPFV